MNDSSDEEFNLVSQNRYVNVSQRGKKMAKSKGGPQILAGVTAALSTAAWGFHVTWPAPSLVKLQAEDSDIPVTSSQGAWIVGFCLIGTLCTSVNLPILIDRIGRKKLLLLSAVPQLVGCLLIAFARTYVWLYAARFVIGLGCGFLIGTVTIYIGEIAEDEYRGALCCVINNAGSLGTVLAYCVGPWADRGTLIAVGAAIPVLTSAIFIWMPESPYFFCMKRNPEEARRSLMWLRGKSDVDEELKTIGRNVQLDQLNAGGLREFLGSKNRKSLAIAAGLAIAQETSGILVISAYSGLIFEASGAKLGSQYSMIIVAVFQLISGLLSILTTTVIGRRPLLLSSIVGCIVFLCGEAIYFQLQDAGKNVDSIYWLPVTSIVGYIFMYTIGLGVIPSGILSEIFSCNVKALSIMFSILVVSISGLVATKMYQIVADAYGIAYSFWLFAGMSFVMTIFIYHVVPETRNKSLRDIHDHLRAIAKPKTDVEIISKNLDSSRRDYSG